jgi:hypothetical protein
LPRKTSDDTSVERVSGRRARFHAAVNGYRSSTDDRTEGDAVYIGAGTLAVIIIIILLIWLL